MSRFGMVAFKHASVAFQILRFGGKIPVRLQYCAKVSIHLTMRLWTIVQRTPCWRELKVWSYRTFGSRATAHPPKEGICSPTREIDP